MHGLFDRETFIKALTEGISVPTLKSQNDIVSFCDRMSQFFAETPNEFWVDYDNEMKVNAPIGCAMVIDYKMTPVLRILAVENCVVFSYYDNISRNLYAEAISQAAMGVMLFCGMENGEIEKIDGSLEVKSQKSTRSRPIAFDFDLI